MDTSNNKDLTILDLPNEILLTIFNKLNMINVLYSLVDVDERFDRLILDPTNICNLDMTFNPSFYDICSLNNEILDRICEKVLPRIHHQVNELTVEPRSMKCILHTIEYPQLYSLSLVKFQEELLFHYLTDDLILRDLLTEQITHLNIDIRNKITREKWSVTLSNIFVLILSLCKRLINLNFCPFSINRCQSIYIYNPPSTSCMSSTLTKLKVDVTTFDDCLYLLDGRLDCLSTLIISVKRILFTISDIDNTKKLPKLKCFSLTSLEYTSEYEDQIIPLLRRMINLEELILFLLVHRNDSTYIDGSQLYDEILIHMSQLNKLTFSIKTNVYNEHIGIDLPSNDDIQRTFIGKKYPKVGSYVQTLPMHPEGTCHIYSVPYQFEHFFHLNSSFQGGIFHRVQYLIMTGSRPFEHKLFNLISQDFPFLKNLFVNNDQPQNDKQHSSSLIIFPHLVQLMLNTSLVFLLGRLT